MSPVGARITCTFSFLGAQISGLVGPKSKMQFAPAASAARMKCDDRLGRSSEQFFEDDPVCLQRKNSCGEIIDSKTQFLQRPCELTGGMLALVDLRRSANQPVHTAPAQIALKDSIRIVEIA